MNRFMSKVNSLEALLHVLVTLAREGGRKRCFEPHIYVEMSQKFGGIDEDNFWKYREEIRSMSAYRLFDIRNFLSPEAVASIPPDQFLHRSVDTPGLVAFTEDADKGRADRQVTMKFGRYVKKYTKGMDDQEILLACTAFNRKFGEADVLFARGEDEIIRVIDKGCSESCMQAMDFAGHVHPAAIYDTEDFDVAYMMRDGVITARCICNAKKKLMARCYGDVSRLVPALEKLGYTQEINALVGCRIKRIYDDNGGGFIMAYVDAGIASGGGALYYDTTSDSNYFVLTKNDGNNTTVGNDENGVTDGEEKEEGVRCSHCGEYVDSDSATYVEGGGDICEDCIDEHYVHAIVNYRGGQGWIYLNDSVYVECRNEAYHEDVDLERLGLVYIENGDWVELEDAAKDVDGEWQLRGNCDQCGTIGGEGMYYNREEARNLSCVLFLINNVWVHEDSDEYKDWLSDGEKGQAQSLAEVVCERKDEFISFVRERISKSTDFSVSMAYTGDIPIEVRRIIVHKTFIGIDSYTRGLVLEGRLLNADVASYVLAMLHDVVQTTSSLIGEIV